MVTDAPEPQAPSTMPEDDRVFRVSDTVDGFREWLWVHEPTYLSPRGAPILRETFIRNDRDRAIWNNAYLTCLLDIMPLFTDGASPWLEAREP